jgi:hypothetical protein
MLGDQHAVQTTVRTNHVRVMLYAMEANMLIVATVSWKLIKRIVTLLKSGNKKDFLVCVGKSFLVLFETVVRKTFFIYYVFV